MGINYYEDIITLDKCTLKLIKKRIQEYSVNPEINVPDRPKSGVLMLADLDRAALAVTFLANRGMDTNVDLLNSMI